MKYGIAKIVAKVLMALRINGFNKGARHENSFLYRTVNTVLVNQIIAYRSELGWSWRKVDAYLKPIWCAK